MTIERKTIPEQSAGAPKLVELTARWDALRDGARGDAFASDARAVAEAIVAHRSELFARNAALQASAPSDDDAATIAAMDDNQTAIKLCTTVLGEMTELLGHSGMPA